MDSKHFTFVLLLIASFAATAAVTYYDPVRPQVLNWSVTLGDHLRRTTPLYLDTTGTYVAELYLEPLGSQAGPLTHSTTLAFTLQITRNGKPIVTRKVSREVGPGTTGLTLFDLESPYDLPEDTDLQLALEFGDVDPGLLQTIRSVRLQLTRKPHFAPIPQWQ